MSAEQYQNLSSILMNSISDDELIQAVRSLFPIKSKTFIIKYLVTIKPYARFINVVST
jgi:hypothetical protein